MVRTYKQLTFKLVTLLIPILAGCTAEFNINKLASKVVSFTIAPSDGEYSTKNTSVNIDVLSLKDTPDEMAFFLTSNCTGPEVWEPYAAIKNISFSSPDGPKVVSAKLKTGEVITECQEITITLDQTEPLSTTVTKSGGASPTNNPLVTLTATAVDLTFPVEMMIASDTSCTLGTWSNIATSVLHTLPAPTTNFDGVKEVYYKFRDALGNESVCDHYDINLDTIVPVLTIVPADTLVNTTEAPSIGLTGTCSETGTGNVLISASSTGGGTFANVTANCTAGAWSYTANFSGLNTGTVTVTASQTDTASNPGSASTTITLDKTAPTISFSTPTAGSYINSTTLTAFAITGLCSDNGVGNIEASATSTGGGSYTNTFFDCATGFSNSLNLTGLTDGTVTLTLEITDAAGNKAQTSRNFVLSTNTPTLTAFTIANNDTYSVTPTVALNLTYTGSPVEYYVTETAACASGGSWLTLVASPTFNLGTAIQGARTLYLKIRDGAGNESACLNDSIILDTLAPNGTLSINSGDADTIVQNVAINLTVDSVVTQMYVYEGTCPASSPTFVAYTPRTSVTLANFAATTTDSETRNVSAVLKDAAGNTTCISDPNGILLYNSKNYFSFRSNGFRVTDASASVNIPVFLHDYTGTTPTAISSPLNVSYTIEDGTTLTKGTVTLAAGDDDGQENIAVPIPDVTTEKILKVNLYLTDKKNVPLQSLSQVSISVVDQAATNLPIGVISGSGDHTCIIKGASALSTTNSSGKLWCWGEGSNKQIDGTSGDRNTVTAVDAANDYKDVAAGPGHTCGLLSAGTPNLKCWGVNDSGQLGKGTVDATPPNGMHNVTNPGGNAWTWVSVGDRHTCAIDSTSKLYCWGDDSYGQLGNGATTGVQSSPVEVDSGAVSNTYRQVVAGANHTCAVHTSKYLYCWGNNSNGQAKPDDVGVNPQSPASVVIPGAVPATNPDLKIATATREWDRERHLGAGYAHSCAITSHLAGDNTDTNDRARLYCWGRNTNSESGAADTSVNVVVPYKMSSLGFLTMNAGAATTCAITYNASAAQRTLRCFGNGDSGKLGTGNASDQNIFMVDRDIRNTSLPSVTYNSVAPGTLHTCAVATSTYNTSDDVSPVVQYSVRCAGYNRGGQLGLGYSSDESTPSAVNNYDSGAQAFSKVAMGYRTGCSIDTLGNLYCWGSSSYKMVGDGITTASGTPYAYQRNTPIKIDFGTTYVKATAGVQHACGLTSTGRIKCWGENSDGHIGVGNNDLSAPVSVNPTETYSDISSGSAHTCAITSSGVLQCWGVGAYGQLGDGTTVTKYVPTSIDTGLSFTKVSSGEQHNCAITSTQKLKCWGRNDHGQLGQGNLTDSSSPLFVDLANDYLDVAVGFDHTCAIKKVGASSGQVMCWGNNSAGQIGNNTSGADVTTPTAVLDSGGSTITDEFTKVSTGTAHSCAIRSSDKKVLCWGYNSAGQLGDSTRTARINPTLTSITAASDLSVGGDSSCAIEQADGMMKCWGYDEFASLPLRRKSMFFQFVPGL